MGRKRDDREPGADEIVEQPQETPVAGHRANGPWDAAEKETSGDTSYLDFGSLIIRGRPEFNLQLPTDDDQGSIGSVVLITEESGLELRAFAAARSGGLWDDVRENLIAEVEKMDGEAFPVAGPFGPELHVRVPVELPDGDEGFQPSRIVGIEGPRWMLRATFLGKDALEPDDDGVLMQALHDVVVVRGDEPMAPRDPLLLTISDDLDVIETSVEPE